MLAVVEIRPPPTKLKLMTAVKVIAEMDSLPPDEQAKVIQHAFELARHRQLSADELGQFLGPKGRCRDSSPA